ncbi:hypothetical protein ID866_12999, partial [Astraeus odoratus]
MSSPCCTLSPYETLMAKTKDPRECTEEEWHLISEGELDPVSSDDEDTVKMRDREKKWRVEVQKDEHRRKQEEAEKRAQEEAERLAHEEAARKEAERKAEEEHKVQEEGVKREREEREMAAWMAWADAEQRALEERLWDAAAPPWVAKPGRRMASGVQDPCTWCHNKGTLCILGTAKGKTMACKACRHAKVSCSWMKRMVGEAQKKKWVHRSEEADNIEMMEAGEDDEEEEMRLHFAVLPHLTEEHQDALRALMATLDTLSMEFYEFWRDYWGFGGEVLKVMDTIAQELKRANDLKEEELGKAKGKG